tara:strand:- start:363 stop:650 length:288 start_codon:yes stop_codon:yes gene_type:complete
MHKIKHIEENVRSLLQSDKHKNATNREFIFSYWKTYDGLKSKINLPVFRKLTDTETICRMRRFAVAKTPTLGTINPNMIKEKRLKERKMRKYALS